MSRSRWRRIASAVAVSAPALASTGRAHASDKECMAAASSGQDRRDEGRLLDARGEFQRCAQADCPPPIPRYCGEWLSDVANRIPTLVVRAVDDEGRDVVGATVEVDARAVELDGRAVEVDPGRHRIRVTRPGKKPFETEIVAAEGERGRVLLAKLASEAAVAPSVVVAPVPAPAARPSFPTGTWIAWGIGAAGLASFVSFGLKATVDYDGYRSSCVDQCSTSDRDSVATAVAVADVSLVIGLVGAGVGTLLYLMQPKPAGRAATATAMGRR